MTMILDLLLAKTGDAHTKLKNESNSAIMIASKHPMIGPEMVVDRIIKETLSKSSMKHLAAKLLIMKQIIDQNNVAKNMDSNRMISYAVSHLQSSNAQVRY